MSAGSLKAMSTPVSNGTVSSHGEMVNVFVSANKKSVDESAPAADFAKPATRNIIKEMTKEGIVVTSIYLICGNNSAPADDDANMVVSESGEILSPK